MSYIFFIIGKGKDTPKGEKTVYYGIVRYKRLFSAYDCKGRRRSIATNHAASRLFNEEKHTHPKYRDRRVLKISTENRVLSSEEIRKVMVSRQCESKQKAKINAHDEACTLRTGKTA